MRSITPILAAFIVASCSSEGSKDSTTHTDPPIDTPTVVSYVPSVSVDNTDLAYGETATIVFAVVNNGNVERPAAIRLQGEISGLSVDAAPGETWTQVITLTNNRVEVDPAFVIPQTDTYTYEFILDGSVQEMLTYEITTTPGLIGGAG
jgi:hypothetical protein